ncbi:MAG: hypothetical protein DCC58_11435 [Chloroflexi bacterium]|nr:MAG: hypothetical protein DCC58_11435 [Chloroflexota bacterium]
MTGRKCSTCKHYEAAPIWRKGWCRNSLLYSPQQSHLVGEDDLDCERGMGNYWEPADSALISPRNDAASSGTNQTPPSRPLPVVTDAGRQIFVVSGSSGYGSDSGPEPPPPSGGRGSSGGSGGGSLNYYTDERYWTDWVRILLPILGVLLVVILFWLWASSFLGDDDNNGGLVVATGTSTLPTIGPTATSGDATPAGTPTSPIVITTVTPGAGATNTPSAGSSPTDTPSSNGPSGEIYPGAVVVVANTGGDGANLRSEPSSSAAVVTILLEGTQLTTTGDPIEGDGLLWWPVTGVDGDGYVAADFLELAE